MKKYELDEDTIVVDGHTLHPIRALKDFADVKAGEFGGFVESEDNLSQEGDCWVYGDAKVYGKAQVFENAKVLDEAEVFGNAKVFGKAQVLNKFIRIIQFIP